MNEIDHDKNQLDVNTHKSEVSTMIETSCRTLYMTLISVLSVDTLEKKVENDPCDRSQYDIWKIRPQLLLDIRRNKSRYAKNT